MTEVEITGKPDNSKLQNVDSGSKLEEGIPISVHIMCLLQ